ncbi:hypothetical protein TNIN_271911, partial [Trichonephila inaurata madagascariensis]
IRNQPDQSVTALSLGCFSLCCFGRKRSTINVLSQSVYRPKRIDLTNEITGVVIRQFTKVFSIHRKLHKD